MNNVDIFQQALQNARARALDAIAARAADHARSAAPVNTGTLRDSIAHAVEDGAAIIGSPLPYAPRAEDKTPFLRPAMEAHAEEYRAVLEAILKNA